jgi:hypothetical protein
MNRWEQWSCFVALACASAAAHGGAYMRSEGELLHEVRVDYLRADQAWDAGGTARATPCTQQHSSLMTSFDYGFSYYLSGFAAAGVARAGCGPEEESGPSDLSFGARGRLNMFTNNRAWEVEAYVPARALGGSSDLGCNAYGGALRLNARQEVRPGGFVDYGAGYQYWDAPLVPQAVALIGYSAGPDPMSTTQRWEWGTALSGTWSLEENDIVRQGSGTQLDCGARGRVVRASLDVHYKSGLHSRVGCGLSVPVWGRDSQITQGLSCAYSVLWE